MCCQRSAIQQTAWGRDSDHAGSQATCAPIEAAQSICDELAQPGHAPSSASAAAEPRHASRRAPQSGFNIDVAARHSSCLVDSPLARVYDVVCQAPRSGYSDPEWAAVTEIVLPRRGVFVVERCGEPTVVDTNAAIVFGLDEEYRVSHPADSGDACTVLILPPELVEAALGDPQGRAARLEPRQHLGVCLVTDALRECQRDELEKEEAALLLLAALAPAFEPWPPARPVLGAAQRLRVEQARALLASAPTTHWDLRMLAQTLQCSPFHLARQFRAGTGETISRYLLRLRLGIAVERLAAGERNIAALAIAIGFTHHSHFSARFRGAFGITPSEARDLLTKRKLSRLRDLIAERR